MIAFSAKVLSFWLLVSGLFLSTAIVLKRHGRSKDDGEENSQLIGSALKRAEVSHDLKEYITSASLLTNKTVFSDQKRLIFFLSFDNSPHSLVSTIFSDCIAAGDCNVVRNFTHQLSTLSRNKTDNPKTILATITDTILSVQNQHQKRGAFIAPLPDTMIKAQFDFPFVATIAEKAGVDMRILILVKEFDDLNSIIPSRVELDGTLLSLQTQLRRLDPQFYRCIKQRTALALSKSEKEALSMFY